MVLESSINNLSYSVVIPMYNAEKTILSCLSSVTCQNLLPLEVIVVDDGSSDKSVFFVQNFIRDLQNSSIEFILLTQQNSGPSQARNNGVRRAKAQYIAFIDADDRWDCTKNFQQLNFIQNHLDYKLVGMSGDDKGKRFKPILFKHLIYKNYFQTSTVLASRDVLLEFPFDVEQKYSEDYKVWLQIVKKYPAALVLGRRAENVKKLDFYSNGGLSANLQMMIMFELANFRFLRSMGAMNSFQFLSAYIFSLIKYLKRLLYKKFGRQ